MQLQSDIFRSFSLLNVTYNFLTRTDTNKVEKSTGREHPFDQFKIRISSVITRSTKALIVRPNRYPIPCNTCCKHITL